MISELSVCMFASNDTVIASGWPDALGCSDDRRHDIVQRRSYPHFTVRELSDSAGTQRADWRAVLSEFCPRTHPNPPYSHQSANRVSS